MQESGKIKRQWSGMSESRIDSIKRIWDSLWGNFWATVFLGWSSTLQSTLLNKRYADKWSQSNVIIYSGPRKLSLALIWWMIAYLYFLELESQSSSGNCNRWFVSVLSGVDGGCPNKLRMWNVSLFKSNTSGEVYLHWHVQAFNKQTEKKVVCYKPNFILLIL